MFRLALALIGLVLFASDALACHGARAGLFRGKLRAGVVYRERHVVRERGAVLPRVAVVAPKCGPTGCPAAPAPAPKK